MSTLAGRMNDFRPRVIGHAQVPGGAAGLAGERDAVTTITGQALGLDLAVPAWPYPGVATVRALITALGAAGEPAPAQEQAVRQFMLTPAWQAAPGVLHRDVHRWLDLLWMSAAEMTADTGLAFPSGVPGFTGQGWSTQETEMAVRWLLHDPAAWEAAMEAARAYPGNPHAVADTLHEHIVPRTELEAIAAAGGDPAKVNWLEIAHELIERRDDPRPQPGSGHANGTPALALAHEAAVAPQAMQAPGLPVPDDKTAAAMFTAHRTDDILHELAHARERMKAARHATGALRRYHSGHIDRHLQNALASGHQLTANIREHYPEESAELEQVKRHVGLAASVSEAAKAATTAHLLETSLHEMTHGARHARAMLEDPDPDGDEWEFNADHAQKHLGGAVEHASKLAEHWTDNYPHEGRWLARLGHATAPPEEGDGSGKKEHAKPQHARYSKGKSGGTVSAQMAAPLTISGQAAGPLDLAGWHDSWRHQPRGPRGQWMSTPGSHGGKPLPWHAEGDVAHYHGSLGVDRADMPQVSGTLADGSYAPSKVMMPKFLDHLKAEGVPVTRERVPASSLKPTQTAGDMRAVRGITASLASGEMTDTKPVLVSSDNRVIDGHHQWAAHVLADAKGTRAGSEPGVPVIRAGLPAAQLMDQARRFAKAHGIQSRKTGQAANPEHALKPITEQAAPADTLEKYTRPDGTLTPQRAALHRKIINGILAGHQPQEHPVATFYGGGPASGKSTALKPGAPDSAVIDSDEIKAQLPEYQKMREAGDPRAAAYVHEESSAISKQAMREAQARHLNYVLDSTGDGSLEKLAGKVNAAKRAGYMTDGRYVTTHTDEAVRRSQARAAATGRHVPEEYIRAQHAAVSGTYGKAAKMGLFDRTQLWDTTGSAPKLVAGKEPGGEFTVHDPAAWQRFLAKAGKGAP